MIYSILGAILALAVFVAGWLIGFAAFTILDDVRGLGNSWVQEIFRELVVPLAAGYLSNFLAAEWVRTSDAKIVFYIFSVTLALVAGVNVGVVLPIATRIGETPISLAFILVTYIAGIAGAYIFVRDRL